MGESTEIGWTDATFNPWWGCEKVSPGCDNCYAETFSHRLGQEIWGHNAPHRFFSDKHWNGPLKWNKKAEAEGRQERVFCASMADVFQLSDDLVDQRRRLWDLILATPHLTWQLLTKRPENVKRMVPIMWLTDGWPDNVWLGTTAEDQTRANIRVPRLLSVPGVKVRFLSCEPLIGPILLAPWLHEGIDWVIAGGESGAGFRGLDVEHARVIRDECIEAKVPFFFKQHGGLRPKAGGDLLDGEEWKEFPSDTAEVPTRMFS